MLVLIFPSWFDVRLLSVPNFLVSGYLCGVVTQDNLAAIGTGKVEGYQTSKGSRGKNASWGTSSIVRKSVMSIS